MKQNNTQEEKQFPYEPAVHYGKEHTNKFDGRHSKAAIENEDKVLEIHRAGQQIFRYSQANKREKAKEHSLIPQTQLEKEAEIKKAILLHLQLKPNMLRYVSAYKVWLLFILAFCGMLGEYFIYQTIGENAFGMSFWKSVFIGLTVLVFVKFIQLVFHKHVKHWLKENNLRFKSFFKITLLSFVALILINALLMGITNLSIIEQNNKIDKLTTLSNDIAEGQEYGEDTSEMEDELAQLQNELGEGDSPFLRVVKLISIALLGLLTIGAGSLIFSVADLNKEAYSLKKKIEKKKDEQANHRANLEYLKTTRKDLLSLQKEIIQMYGQKHFLETLLSKNRESDLVIKDN